MKIQIRSLALILPICGALSGAPALAENVRVAIIDPLSGALSPSTFNLRDSFNMFVEEANSKKWAGNNTIEYVNFDNKLSPQESLKQLKSAIDQGFRYVVQGNGSGVALALIDAINKHNERNPGKEVLFLNVAAIDPDLTNSKCSFWHFRFDANSDMKMEALTTFMIKDQSIKKVFIIGQNYAHGHQVQRAAKEYIRAKRPDIEIVGDDLHPIAQVKDFSPYIAKIRASGADTVITGNWGADLSLLIKAAKEADLKVNFYTYYAGVVGTPSAIGASGVDRVKYVGNWNPNNETYTGQNYIDAFKRKYPKDDFYAVAPYAITAMLSKAIKDAKSTDPIKVAYALEGMKIKSLNGEVEMRKSDHQLQQPLYIATWVKANNTDVKNDAENTGYGWKTEKKIESYVASQPTSCAMTRPAKS